MIPLIIILSLSFLEDNESHTICVPRLGTFGMPVEVCSGEWYPHAECLFMQPWCRLGADWTLRPGIARSWSIRNGHFILVLSENAAVYMSESGGFSDTSVTPMSSHIVSITVESGWPQLLEAPEERDEDTMIVGFGGYDIQQWVREQHIILNRNNPDRVGPDNIMVTACASRERMVEGFVSGEFDIIDDISFEERALLCGNEDRYTCFARRSNSLLYLMWNSTCLDVSDPAIRSVLGQTVDRKRLAARVGSRPSWITPCPLPPRVPGSWSTLPVDMDTAGTDIHIPESITILTEPRWEAVQAGKEVKTDISHLGVDVRLVTSDQWIRDPMYMHETAAIIGVWEVEPNAILPPSPRGWDDPLSLSRTACEITTYPSSDIWIAVSERLQSAFAEDMGMVCSCWLSRWAPLDTSWNVPDPGPGPLDGQIDRWTFGEMKQ